MLDNLESSYLLATMNEFDIGMCIVEINQVFKRTDRTEVQSRHIGFNSDFEIRNCQSGNANKY